MSEPKPFASLSSTLLARKGQAKPAMRPQGFTEMSGHDDLGWNDMGHPASRLTPAETVPAIVTQQAAIAKELGVEEAPKAVLPETRPAEVVSIARSKGGLLARAKAAFTLRLDPDRHLKLRLACAVDHRSAQQIVTQALDEYLSAMPELEVLADKVPARGKH
jgi:hypothetical protein